MHTYYSVFWLNLTLVIFIICTASLELLYVRHYVKEFYTVIVDLQQLISTTKLIQKTTKLIRVFRGRYGLTLSRTDDFHICPPNIILFRFISLVVYTLFLDFQVLIINLTFTEYVKHSFIIKYSFYSLLFVFYLSCFSVCSLFHQHNFDVLFLNKIVPVYYLFIWSNTKHTKHRVVTIYIKKKGIVIYRIVL